MMSYDAMSVEDAMDYLNVTLNGARALKKHESINKCITFCRLQKKFALRETDMKAYALAVRGKR